MLRIDQSNGFKRDMKRALKRGKLPEKLFAVVDMLCVGQPLPVRYRDHVLKGNWKEHRECHLEPDWLLIYRVADDCLYLVATGTHSDLFKT